MVRRFIAAGLLLVVAAWAEFLLAPMLVMHAMSVAPAQELTQPAGHHHAGTSTHPCCPRVHPVPVAPLIELAASGFPAGTHRCCFQPGPQSAPTTARDGHRQSKDAELPNATAMNPPSPAFPRLSLVHDIAQSPPSTSGVILRV